MCEYDESISGEQILREVSQHGYQQIGTAFQASPKIYAGGSK